jgi:hypothetical protein
LSTSLFFTLKSLSDNSVHYPLIGMV